MWCSKSFLGTVSRWKERTNCKFNSRGMVWSWGKASVHFIKIYIGSIHEIIYI